MTTTTSLHLSPSWARELDWVGKGGGDYEGSADTREALSAVDTRSLELFSPLPFLSSASKHDREGEGSGHSLWFFSIFVSEVVGSARLDSIQRICVDAPNNKRG